MSRKLWMKERFCDICTIRSASVFNLITLEAICLDCWLERFFNAQQAKGKKGVDMANEAILFNSVMVAVCAGGNASLVSSPDERLWNLMEGSLFEDNSEWGTMSRFPMEPGVYSMTIEYQFNQGFSEGYPSDGESTWDFIPSNIKKLM